MGVSTLFLEGRELAYYYYAFYDLNYYARNLGMFMMTSAVALFSQRRCRRLYLGTCYSRNALYKTQFAGAQFFNGFRWSEDLAELKFILRRDAGELSEHLLEAADYRRLFHHDNFDDMSPPASSVSTRIQINRACPQWQTQGVAWGMPGFKTHEKCPR